MLEVRAISGLPRTGSTLLHAIVRQHPLARDVVWSRSLLGTEARCVCTVRPIVEILASFVALARRSSVRSVMGFEALQRGYPDTEEGFCDYLLADGPLGLTMAALRTAKDVLIVRYDDLCAEPHRELGRVAEFFGLFPYPWRLDDIRAEPVNDMVWGLPGLHDVRPVLGKTSPDPREVLGPLFDKYASLEIPA